MSKPVTITGRAFGRQYSQGLGPWARTAQTSEYKARLLYDTGYRGQEFVDRLLEIGKSGGDLQRQQAVNYFIYGR